MSYRCKECERLWHRDYYQRKGRAHYESRREKIAEQIKLYRSANPEHYKTLSAASSKRYYDSHRAARVKAASDYAKRQRELGLFNKERKNANARAQRARNPEVTKEKARQYRLKRKEQLAEYFRTYTLQHREEVRRAKEKWKQNHPDEVRFHKAQSQRRRQSRMTGTVTAKEWKRILLFYGRACGKCKTPEDVKPLTVDHWMPIAKGGSNTWQNVWPLCIDCNLKKRAKLPDEPHPPHVRVFVKTGT